MIRREDFLAPSRFGVHQGLASWDLPVSEFGMLAAHILAKGAIISGGVTGQVVFSARPGPLFLKIQITMAYGLAPAGLHTLYDFGVMIEATSLKRLACVRWAASAARLACA